MLVLLNDFDDDRKEKKKKKLTKRKEKKKIYIQSKKDATLFVRIGKTKELFLSSNLHPTAQTKKKIKEKTTKSDVNLFLLYELNDRFIQNR